MSRSTEKMLEVLNKAIVYGFACDAHKKRPGIVIQHMSQADRDILKELTSKDTENQRPLFLEK